MYFTFKIHYVLQCKTNVPYLLLRPRNTLFYTRKRTTAIICFIATALYILTNTRTCNNDIQTMPCK